MSCTECPAFTVFGICPQKPKREAYEDENKYLIDLESGVWDCKTTIGILCQKIQDLQEELEQTKLQNTICEEGLKKENKDLREKVHFWKKEVNVANKNAAEEYSELKFKYDNLNNCFNTSKSIIEKLYGCLMQDDSDPETVYYIKKYMNEAEKFLKVN